MSSDTLYDLKSDAIRIPYTKESALYCNEFSCNDADLDDFFRSDAFLYESELLGKSYAWVDGNNTKDILGIVTISNDSVKAKSLGSSARNRIQRGINNAKRGLNYPATLIGRLGVSVEYRGKGFNIGTQILNYLKDWLIASDSKSCCRFLVVDAYNNERTLNFYHKNGFKFLYKTGQEERDFLQLDENDPLKTRFMFFDLKPA